MPIFTVPLSRILSSGERLSPGLFYSEKIRPRSADRSLMQVAEVITKRISREVLQNHEFSYIDISSINAEHGVLNEVGLVTGDDVPEKASWNVSPGDVVMSLVRPERGAVAIVPDLDGMIVASGSLAVIRPRSASSSLLRTWLRSSTMLRYIELIALGSTLPQISLNQVKSLPFPNVISDEANTLGNEIAAVIQRGKANIDSEEDRLLRALGIELPPPKSPLFWLNREQLTTERMDPGYLHPYPAALNDALKRSPFRRTTLGEIASITVGTPAKKSGSENKRIVLGPTNIEAGRLNLNEVRELQLARDPVVAHESDVIIVTAGSRLGSTAVVSGDADGLTIDNSLALIRLATAECMPSYLSVYLNSKLGDTLMRQLSLGITAPRLTKEGLAEVPIVLPTVEVQNQVILQMDAHYAYSNDAARSLADLESALMHELTYLERSSH
jgi:type I restriction enzyme S subunit